MKTKTTQRKAQSNQRCQAWSVPTAARAAVRVRSVKHVAGIAAMAPVCANAAATPRAAAHQGINAWSPPNR